jgi:hypothetical protein
MYSGSWRFYQVASDDTATDLPVTEIDRQVGDCSNTLFGCDFYETVGVELPEAALRTHADTGYRIQVRAKSGNSQVLVVTKEQINSSSSRLTNWCRARRRQAVRLRFNSRGLLL